MALMAKVTYLPIKGSHDVEVYLDSRHAGTIFRRDNGTFYYQPKGTDVTSREYPTLDAMKASLEGGSSN